MRCPSCGFISFDHLAACKKCGVEFPPPPGGRRAAAPPALAEAEAPGRPAPPPAPPAAPAGRPPGAGAEDAATQTIITGTPAPDPFAPAEDTFGFTLPAAVAAPARPATMFDPGAPIEMETEADFPPAGFWIRFVATVVDSAILFVVMFILFFAIGIGAGVRAALGDPVGLAQVLVGLGAAVTIISLVVPMLYEVIFVGLRGQTPGKVLLGLKIIRMDGGEVDYVKAFIRWVGKLASGFLLGIGYIMAAFTANKRALHDLIAGTRVIRL